MAEVSEKIIISKFNGGISPSSKSGLPNSFRLARNLDIYSDEDSVTLNPQPLRDDGGVVTGLVTDICDCRPFTATRYAYDNLGKIYAISNNVWSLDRTLATSLGAAGQGLGLLADTLFYASSQTLGKKQYLSQGGVYNDDFLSDGVKNADVIQTASGQNYNVPVALSELAQDSFVFSNATALTKDPMKAVSLTISQKGTGSLTVYLHDASNVLLGSATLTNLQLINGVNTFSFANPPRIIIGNIYHLHVVATTADISLQTSINQNLQTAQLTSLFSILIADTMYHPIAQHVNGVTGIICIGNERYIATYDMSTYLPNKITLEPGWVVRGFSKEQEFLVAYCWKGSAVNASEYGRAYYWDGIQPYFNYYKELTSGVPNAMINNKERTFSIVGSRGELALGAEPYRFIQPAPKLSKGASVEVTPHALCMWQNRAHIGYGNTNDSGAGAYQSGANGQTPNVPQGFEPGVYEFGAQTDRSVSYTSVSLETLNFGFLPSSGVKNPTSFKIGCVVPFGQDLYISWQDGSFYGVDRVNKLNPPAQTGSYESLVIDIGLDIDGQLKSLPQKTKLAQRLIATCAALPQGCTLTPKYRINRSTPWVYGPTINQSQIIAQTNFGSIGGLRYREIEIGFDISATVNYPVILSLTLVFDPLIKETDVN